MRCRAAKRILSWAAALVVVLLCGERGAAQGAEDLGSERCGCHRPRSAIDTVTSAVAEGLGTMPADTLVVAARLRSDTAAPRAQELVVGLAHQVAGRLGPSCRAHPQPLALGEARSVAGGMQALVWIQVEITRGQLRLRADGYPVPRTVWQRARAPEPGARAHAYAQAPLDAEVRGFLAPLGLGAPVVEKMRGIDRNLVALGCGDLNGDGILELVTVGRGRIVLLRRGDGQAQELRSVPWGDLAAIAPVPLRQPIGFATVVAADPWGGDEPTVHVGLTDRARSVRLDADLAKRADLEGISVPTGRTTACVRARETALDRRLSPCHEADSEPLATDLSSPFDALASTIVVDRSGKPRVLVASRSRSVLTLRSDDEKPQALGLVGAQIGLGDVDQDGAVEVASSLDVLDPRRDGLVVRTVWADGREIERYRVAVPSGIEAIAVCPPDGPGRSALALATQGELWVIR